MHRFDLAANCSLTAHQAVAFFAGMATVSLVVALGFLVIGYWPILPFAGLELALLGWAIRHNWRAAQRRESIIIDGDEITISRWQDNEQPVVTTIPRAWTRVELIQRRNRARDLQLAIGREGKWWVVGSFLVDSEKRSLKARISQVLRQGAHSGRLSETA